MVNLIRDRLVDKGSKFNTYIYLKFSFLEDNRQKRNTKNKDRLANRRWRFYA